jgi:hypothetical protein
MATSESPRFKPFLFTSILFAKRTDGGEGLRINGGRLYIRKEIKETGGCE